MTNNETPDFNWLSALVWIITLVFVNLKLMNIIAWSWFLIFSPVILYIVVFLLIMIYFLVFEE